MRYLNSDYRVALAAGNALESMDWEDDAIDAYAAALSLEHDLAASPYWEATEFRRESFSGDRRALEPGASTLASA